MSCVLQTLRYISSLTRHSHRIEKGMDTLLGMSGDMANIMFGYDAATIIAPSRDDEDESICLYDEPMSRSRGEERTQANIFMSCLMGRRDEVKAWIEHVTRDATPIDLLPPIEEVLAARDAALRDDALRDDALRDAALRDDAPRRAVPLARDNESVEKGKGLEVVDDYGRTPLLLAVTCHEWDIVTDLLLAGANSLARGHDGRTVLHIAAVSDDGVRLIEQLPNVVAMINEQDNDGNTPLHLAVLSHSHDMVEALLDIENDGHQVANPNLCNFEMSSPLHYCVVDEDEQIARMLIVAGTNLRLVDDEGKTALNIALEHGERRLTRLYAYSIISNEVALAKAMHRKIDGDVVKSLVAPFPGLIRYALEVATPEITFRRESLSLE